MVHPLKGKTQTKEHIEKRIVSFKKTIALNPLPLKDVTERLLTKITKQEGCWIWTGTKVKKPNGYYGHIVMGRTGSRKTKKAHRVSYEHFVGPIPEGMELDHLCHNTLCINPEHLEPVTHAENMKRRKDSDLPYCRRGHKWTAENTYYHSKNGRRLCRECGKIRMLSYYHRTKIAV